MVFEIQLWRKPIFRCTMEGHAIGLIHIFGQMLHFLSDVGDVSHVIDWEEGWMDGCNHRCFHITNMYYYSVQKKCDKKVQHGTVVVVNIGRMAASTTR